MIIENFHINARKVAGSVMPVSVLAAGVSSAAVPQNNNFNNNNNFGSSFDPGFLQQPFQGYGNRKKSFFFVLKSFSSNRPPSPNTQRKQQAPMNPNNNAFATRDAPPPPPVRPNMPPNAFGGNAALPTPMLPQYVFIA